MAKLNSGTRVYGNTAIDTFLTVSGAVASTSNTTGTIIVTGGVGVSGNVYANGIYSNDKLGIGLTSAISSWTKLEIKGTAGSQDGANQQLSIQAPTTTAGQGAGIRLSAASGANEAVGIIGVVNNTSGTAGAMTFHVYNGGATVPEYMRLDNAGNFGIGTTSPSTGKFSDASYAFLIQSASTSTGTNIFASNSDNSKFVGCWSGHSGAEPAVGVKTGNAFTFGAWAAINGTGGFTERMRISSDGVLQVGRTAGSAPDGKLQVGATGTGAGAANTKLGFALIEDDSGNGAGLWLGSMTNQNTGVIGSRTATGNIAFQTYDGGWGERMRLTYQGNLLVGKTAVNGSDGGFVLSVGSGTDQSFLATNIRGDGGGEVVVVNRQGSDGTLIQFRQANIEEGTISVSGTTVTYGGGHLARFGQLPDGSQDPTLLKGTVLTNLDEMCVWINKKTGVPADNEQCNKVKISDVDGDANVAGVFVSWSYDEQHDTNDLFVAMTGDMIIRIAQGVTVARGDLLMSAGDGTAKPQGDDIVRSKTVAKVTSNHVTCTYEDGSYCVPCVLMAC